MKKILFILFVLILCLHYCACNNNADSENVGVDTTVIIDTTVHVDTLKAEDVKIR